jgi:hypothetical protein
VAAAAAIVLGVMILPRVTGDEPQERNVTAAVGADTGSAPEAGAAPVPASRRLRPLRSRRPTTTKRACGGCSRTPTSRLLPGDEDAAAQLAAREQVAVDCLRMAAGDWIPEGAKFVRLIDATTRATPATIGVFWSPARSGRGGRHARHCGLLANIVG